MDGMETTRRIMAARPTPIVVVAANVESEDLRISMNALKAGALSVVEKPVGVTHADYATLARHICQQLVLMSDVKLVRQRGNGSAAAPTAPRGADLAPGSMRRATNRARVGDYAVLGIVASTGGPNALVQVLGAIGSGFPLPILIVQHMTETFHAGFVSWLADSVPMPLVLAVDGGVPRPGHAYVAPANAHLRLDGAKMKFVGGEPVSGQRPSGTVLFESMATWAGRRAIGVLLTGMGDDGAQGLRAIFDAGGYTIAEDESTAVVYGMPAAAVKLGAVVEVLPRPAIAPRLDDLALRLRVVAS
jgi:two-component system chemotaxis response regulator CheB